MYCVKLIISKTGKTLYSTLMGLWPVYWLCTVFKISLLYTMRWINSNYLLYVFGLNFLCFDCFIAHCVEYILISLLWSAAQWQYYSTVLCFILLYSTPFLMDNFDHEDSKIFFWLGVWTYHLHDNIFLPSLPYSQHNKISVTRLGSVPYNTLCLNSLCKVWLFVWVVYSNTFWCVCSHSSFIIILCF